MNQVEKNEGGEQAQRGFKTQCLHRNSFNETFAAQVNTICSLQTCDKEERSSKAQKTWPIEVINLPVLLENGRGAYFNFRNIMIMVSVLSLLQGDCLKDSLENFKPPVTSPARFLTVYIIHPKQLCIGPCCIPLHALFAFLLAMAHQRGWLLWIKREWLTFGYWRSRIHKALGRSTTNASPSAESLDDVKKSRTCCQSTVTLSSASQSGKETTNGMTSLTTEKKDR